LTVQGTKTGFHLRWTATGDDGLNGRASSYGIRYAASNLASGWDSANVIHSAVHPSQVGRVDSLNVSGIGAGPWEFGIKVSDDAGNMSNISNVVVALIDSVPPGAISDLAVRSTAQGFYLRWTAPLDNDLSGRVAEYDIRYASNNLAANWESANVVLNSLTPSASGHFDSTSVLGIGLGPWEFAVKSIDAAGNVSEMSNVVLTSIPEDVTPPAAVTDLSVDLITEGSVILLWTASGDDNAAGQASAYDLRYSQSPITSGNWESATRALGLPTPRQSGQLESFTILNLQKGPTYYFALQVLDDVENQSALSNSPSATLSSPIQLTFNTQYSASDPDWSPNGQSIVFGSQAEISPSVVRQELFVVPSAGGTAVRFTSFPDGATQAAWSPTGAKLAFTLYVNDGNQRVLGIMDAFAGASAETLAEHSTDAVGSATWAPDGSLIAYSVTGLSPPAPPSSLVYSVPSAGGMPNQIIGDGSWAVAGLDWSPDGLKIAYSSNQSGPYHIWVMFSNGDNPTQLTNGSGNEQSPSWSPDGSKILYVVSGQEIRVVYSNGQNPTSVTYDNVNTPFRRAVWSPDGTMIAYGITTNQVTNIWKLKVK